MDMMNAIDVSAGGMAAQSLRMKIISENIANADSIGGKGGEAYRRRSIDFEAVLNRETGAMEVKPGKVRQDYETPLRQVYDPGNPYANEDGVVQYPNVNTLVENVDMRESVRLYEANMAAIEASKQMMVRSINLLR